MSTIQRDVIYRCSDDCQMSGCPGHKATLEWQSVSDAYAFNLGGRALSFERGELDALLTLLYKVGRFDSAGSRVKE